MNFLSYHSLNKPYLDCQRKCVDELVDGSLRLLDVCNIAKEVLTQSKERTLELQSVLRRKRGSDINGVTVELKKYLGSRKVIKKAIQKALVGMKGVVKSSSKEDNSDLPIIKRLREMEAVALNSLESLFSFISGTKSSSSWSLVSKLVNPERVSCETEESKTNEFAKVDATLECLKPCKMVPVGDVQNQLEILQLCVSDLEQGLEGLFRKLIKTRASLLNILNH